MDESTGSIAAPSVAPIAAATEAPTTAPAAAPASVLGGGATAAQAAPEDPNAWAPEKHRVFGEDGKTLNLEATARKVAEAYGHAEKRLGSGDVPPKSADDYRVTVPEKLAEQYKADDLQKDPMLQAFLKDAHAAGMTQRQVDMAVGAWLERAPGLVQGVKQLGADEAVAALRETWKSEAEFKSNVQAAYRAGQAYAGQDFDGILADYGNDPRIVRMLAKVGAELSEDMPAPAGAVAGFQADLEQLSKSDAYMNPRHPDHTVTKQKVTAMFERQYGNSAKRPGPIVINT